MENKTKLNRQNVVVYYRVSTGKQDHKRQLPLVKDFLQYHIPHHKIIKDFKDSRSGGYGIHNLKRERPMLHDAVQTALKYEATLIFSSVDRLSRISGLLSVIESTGVSFRFADMPEADITILKILEVFAERERREIAKRVKQGLDAKRFGPIKEIKRQLKTARGKKKVELKKQLEKLDSLGANNSKIRQRWESKGKQKSIDTRKEIANDNAKMIEDRIRRFRNEGKSMREIAFLFNKERPIVPTFSGKKGARWHITTVARVMKRLGIN